MNHALAPVPPITARRGEAALGGPSADAHEHGRERRVRSLLALFSLYAGALLAVMILSDGGDVGCILSGIAGHVMYATGRIVTSWRDASWLEHAHERARLRRAI